MPPTPALVGSRLRQIREHFSADLDEVARATGIPEQSLVAFEGQHKLPTGDEILILADYFKCDFRFFISEDELGPFHQTEALFRKYENELTKEDRWAIQELLYLCECEEFLMSTLSSQDRSVFQFQKRGKYFKRHAEDAASELRRFLGYTQDVVPKDVYRDFRRIGLHIFRRQLANSEISGLCIRHPKAGKCVLVNYREDVYRQRFSVTHEVAHALLDDESDVFVSFDESRWSKKDLSEIRANTFASRYLVPPEFLHRIPYPTQWDPDKAITWANNLRINVETLANALKSSRLIADEVYLQLKSVRIPGELKIDPELPESLSAGTRARREAMLRRGLSPLYVDLCFRAYREGIVSAGRLAEMLLTHTYDLAGIAEVYGERLEHGD